MAPWCLTSLVWTFWRLSRSSILLSNRKTNNSHKWKNCEFLNRSSQTPLQKRKLFGCEVRFPLLLIFRLRSRPSLKFTSSSMMPSSSVWQEISLNLQTQHLTSRQPIPRKWQLRAPRPQLCTVSSRWRVESFATRVLSSKSTWGSSYWETTWRSTSAWTWTGTSSSRLPCRSSTTRSSRSSSQESLVSVIRTTLHIPLLYSLNNSLQESMAANSSLPTKNSW